MSATPPAVIAIDGPSASGKGTVAQNVARALAFNFLDSGALYRLVALAALARASALDDAGAIAAIAQGLDVVFDAAEIRLEGRAVTDLIREERVSGVASQIAAMAPVRQALLERQRAFRRPPGLVADGRDMGSVVFPDAKLKIFLTAEPAERARRRYKQLMEKGLSASMSALLQEIYERDARDTERAIAPLQRCADAVEIDSTDVTVDEVVAAVLQLYDQRIPKAP